MGNLIQIQPDTDLFLKLGLLDLNLSLRYVKRSAILYSIKRPIKDNIFAKGCTS
jgi:hypothetical protein